MHYGDNMLPTRITSTVLSCFYNPKFNMNIKYWLPKLNGQTSPLLLRGQNFLYLIVQDWAQSAFFRHNNGNGYPTAKSFCYRNWHSKLVLRVSENYPYNGYGGITQTRVAAPVGG